MKITKPKNKYGYYCDVCGLKICKYLKDFRECGGVNIDDRNQQNKDICHDCAKNIMEELLDLHGL